jgi:hypothetical protein
VVRRGCAPEFSVEEGIAETLGIALGDEIAFLVSGREVSAPVTSLREVQWDSFNVNFFVISSPALLGSEPATYITSFYLPEERETVIPELVKRFPSVTLLDVDALLTQVRQVVDRGVMAVEYVFLFTLAAGILVMYAGIQASLEERRLEHGILRTLGTGRRALLTSLAVEFTAAGILAGALASVFAELTGWLLAEQLFGLTFSFNPTLWLIGVFGSGALIGIAGTVATYPLADSPAAADANAGTPAGAPRSRRRSRDGCVLGYSGDAASTRPAAQLQGRGCDLSDGRWRAARTGGGDGRSPDRGLKGSATGTRSPGDPAAGIQAGAARMLVSGQYRSARRTCLLGPCPSASGSRADRHRSAGGPRDGIADAARQSD